MIKMQDEVVQILKTHFGIENYPFTKDQLKKAYRDKSKNLHPDLGGTTEDFQTLNNYYTYLVKLAVYDLKNPTITAELTTRDGIPLSELGLGLGPTINGIDCTDCNREGYSKLEGMHWVVCNHCDDQGMVHKQSVCWSCKGTSKFTQARSRRVVDCRTCGGTGTFTNHRIKVRCSHCHGTKTLYDESNTTYYEKCYECNGTGEIAIYNPVIPKGALATFTIK